mmetsp:Transcript_90/g.282  ORF Transcript_90/g.282 Transcript_90/m.282 type:complete len:225 (-) Transcript_90:532-1206(-)
MHKLPRSENVRDHQRKDKHATGHDKHDVHALQRRLRLDNRAVAKTGGHCDEQAEGVPLRDIFTELLERNPLVHVVPCRFDNPETAGDDVEEERDHPGHGENFPELTVEGVKQLHLRDLVFDRRADPLWHREAPQLMVQGWNSADPKKMKKPDFGCRRAADAVPGNEDKPKNRYGRNEVHRKQGLEVRERNRLYCDLWLGLSLKNFNRRRLLVHFDKKTKHSVGQ